jgi:hypothetical protein
MMRVPFNDDSEELDEIIGVLGRIEGCKYGYRSWKVNGGRSDIEIEVEWPVTWLPC